MTQQITPPNTESDARNQLAKIISTATNAFVASDPNAIDEQIENLQALSVAMSPAG